jgi:excinuclease ABC subunit A
VQEFDPALIIPDRGRSIAEGALLPWHGASKSVQRAYDELLQSLAEHLGFSLQAPLRTLSPEIIGTLLYGSNGDVMPLRLVLRGEVTLVQAPFEGLIPNLRRRLAETHTEEERVTIEQFMAPRLCPACNGARLRPEVRGVTIAGRTIAEVVRMPLHEALGWVLALSENRAADSSQPFTMREFTIATPILKEVLGRVRFLLDVGLGYLELDRTATTLSGGEAQRIRLATQVGAGLSGVLYVLDEPSIGLHPRDHQRLLDTLLALRDLGNSVLVVEHDEETIRAADWLIDIGPGAGEQGGELIASGTLADILAAPRSITGQYLSGRRRIPLPTSRRPGNGRQIELRGCRAHNLQNIDVVFPLGTFICVTGVSGSGKSSLIIDTLYPRLAQQLYNARERPGAHDAFLGGEHLDKIIAIDQTPIGRTPRSNPATYTRVFDPIRTLFAQTPEAKTRGYDASRFSFNVKGGRCENCHGEGLIQVEMQFLPDIYVPCEICNGARYNRETLEVRYRGKNIAEVLAMTVEESTQFFERVPAIAEKLQTLIDVGLGYLRLGQAATTLSGGEAQRIKLAGELARRATGRTLYILDEPTTGLHFADVERLLQVLQRLVDAGNTVLVIEHNLDVIRSADWLIDLGPEGGAAGGTLVACGTPEHVATVAASYTGRYLAQKV